MLIHILLYIKLPNTQTTHTGGRATLHQRRGFKTSVRTTYFFEQKKIAFKSDKSTRLFDDAPRRSTPPKHPGAFQKHRKGKIDQKKNRWLKNYRSVGKFLKED